ncbi:MAG: hypothetical protein B0W54_06040 [Cellvibrio sp. 79]|nr:MAG: hypothetical protein B0W54_06040 [Cellvibrio sp. 79]
MQAPFINPKWHSLLMEFTLTYKEGNLPKGRMMEKLVDYGLSQELFEEWRKPREGTKNPTKANNPVWNWLIKTKLNAWAANRASEHNYYSEGATWSFDRFGQSITELPDGRKIYIGGEHEDWYDPDFYIYNDVVVENIDGSLDIYTYPKNEFPATDSHSATLVNDEIIIIGCLGYMHERSANETPVFALDTRNFSIRKIETTGSNPGWIFKHNSTLLEDGKTLLICQGEIYRDPGSSLTENIHEWNLDLSSRTWSLFKENNWSRWQYIRVDKKRNFLWEICQLIWNKNAGWKEEYEQSLKKLKNDLGYSPDLQIFKSLYEPPLDFKSLPEQEDDYKQHRILIDNVVVRYKEESREVQVTVEGYLPPDTIAILKQDLLEKLSSLVKTQWKMLDI